MNNGFSSSRCNFFGEELVPKIGAGVSRFAKGI
jgi:hypothetical protein